MRTLAEFKRAIKKGIQIKTVYHQEFNGRDEKGLLLLKDREVEAREVVNVNTVSFTLNTLKNSKYIESYCYWPKANEIVFNQDGSITILEEFDDRYVSEKNDKSLFVNGKMKILTYEFVG